VLRDGTNFRASDPAGGGVCCFAREGRRPRSVSACAAHVHEDTVAFYNNQTRRAVVTAATSATITRTTVKMLRIRIRLQRDVNSSVPQALKSGSGIEARFSGAKFHDV